MSRLIVDYIPRAILDAIFESKELQNILKQESELRAKIVAAEIESLDDSIESVVTFASEYDKKLKDEKTWNKKHFYD